MSASKRSPVFCRRFSTCASSRPPRPAWRLGAGCRCQKSPSVRPGVTPGVDGAGHAGRHPDVGPNTGTRTAPSQPPPTPLPPLYPYLLGTMQFGEGLVAGEAASILNAAAERGVTTFDTAEMYPVPQAAATWGDSERILGSWLAGRRREGVVVATKVAGPGGMPWLRGGPAVLDGNAVRAAVDASLGRLGTDYVDLLQLHWPDRWQGVESLGGGGLLAGQVHHPQTPFTPPSGPPSPQVRAHVWRGRLRPHQGPHGHPAGGGPGCAQRRRTGGKGPGGRPVQRDAVGAVPVLACGQGLFGGGVEVAWLRGCGGVGGGSMSLQPPSTPPKHPCSRHRPQPGPRCGHTERLQACGHAWAGAGWRQAALPRSTASPHLTPPSYLQPAVPHV